MAEERSSDELKETEEGEKEKISQAKEEGVVKVEVQETKRKEDADSKKEDKDGEEVDERKEASEKEKSETEKLKEQIENLKKEVEEYKRKWLYTYADFENYRKRVKVDIENAVKDAVGKVLLEFANALDGISQALQHIKDENTRQGVELILKVIQTAFERSGAKLILPSPGDDFSPDFCEAIAKEESEFEEGKIIKVVRAGIEYMGRVIRPASVVVSAGSGKKNEKMGGKSDGKVDESVNTAKGNEKQES